MLLDAKSSSEKLRGLVGMVGEQWWARAPAGQWGGSTGWAGARSVPSAVPWQGPAPAFISRWYLAALHLQPSGFKETIGQVFGLFLRASCFLLHQYSFIIALSKIGS